MPKKDQNRYKSEKRLKEINRKKKKEEKLLKKKEGFESQENTGQEED